MRHFPSAPILLSTLALLSACGGGGGTSSPAPLDITGVWTGDESAAGGPAGLMLVADGMAYGYETQGTTVRYFKGSGYSSDGSSYSFATSRYDESSTVGGSVSDSRTGVLQGHFMSGTSGTLLVTFASTPAGNFAPLHLDAPAASVTTPADLRDYAGTYALSPSGSVTLSAISASSGTLKGSGVGGCDIDGTLARPRADRNVWAVAWIASHCTDSTRDYQLSNGLGVMYLDGSTRTLSIIAFDGGGGWSVISGTQ